MRSEEWWKMRCNGYFNKSFHTAGAAPSAYGISPDGGDK